MTAPAQPADDPGQRQDDQRQDDRRPTEWPPKERHGDASALDESSEPESLEDDLAATAPRRLASQLLPQYSFRTMAVGLTTLALAAFALRQSTRGSIWAEALVFAAGTIVVCFLAYAALFLIAWVPALIGRDQADDFAPDNPFDTPFASPFDNPFADGQLPAQVVPPRAPSD